MNWDYLIQMLRVLIQDYDGSEFTDDRLKQIMSVAAHYVNKEIFFSVTYTVNVTSPDISPDPTDEPDDIFINFVVLRSACMIDQGSLRSAAMISGLEATCGPATMKTLRRMDGFGTLIDSGYCKTYDELKKQYSFGNTSFCKAVLSPFVNENILGNLRITYPINRMNI